MLSNSFLARRWPAFFGLAWSTATALAGAPRPVEPPLPLLAQANPAGESAGAAQQEGAGARGTFAPVRTPSGQVAPSPVTPPPPVVTPSPSGAAATFEPPSLIAPARDSRPSISENVMINLINRLVDKGVLTKQDSTDLLKLAEQDAAQARAQTDAAQQAMVQQAVAQALAQAQPSASGPSPEDLSLEQEAALRVPYIPESLRQELRDELRADVMNQARTEGWAAPRLMPEWATKVRLFGDIRARYEGDYFPEGNDNTGAFPNFNAINTGNPFDTSGTVFSPQLNVDEDRHRARLRVRLGLEANLNYGFTAGFRLATGESNSPVSPNQSLGLANQGQGGQFSKYAIWLDRAFLKYELAPGNFYAGLTVGRFDNPFFSTDIIWDDDLGFDGVALQAKYKATPWLSLFGAGGAFAVFNTDFNFSTNRPDKFRSDDKYLYGGQLGFDLKPRKDLAFKLGVAYYHFDNIAGQLSDPFVPLNAQDQGNTDNTRPSFAQKGNSYRPLRNILSSPLNNFGTTNQFQYFGLATPFRELAVTGRLDYTRWEPFQISLSGEWVKNLAFDKGRLNRFAVNNRGEERNGLPGGFDGGDNGFIVGLRAGNLALAKSWDWLVGANYRYVETDAVVDGFADSDFGGGGTNVKGFSIFGALALTPNVSLFLRYMSSDEVTGPRFKTDILQLDINGRF